MKSTIHLSKSEVESIIQTHISQLHDVTQVTAVTVMDDGTADVSVDLNDPNKSTWSQLD
jgi:hypothetical protein